MQPKYDMKISAKGIKFKLQIKTRSLKKLYFSNILLGFWDSLYIRQQMIETNNINVVDQVKIKD